MHNTTKSIRLLNSTKINLKHATKINCFKALQEVDKSHQMLIS